MPGRYPSYDALRDAGAVVGFSDPAFRLRWRLFLTCPSESPAGGPSKATVKTQWRILPSVPGSDAVGRGLATWWPRTVRVRDGKAVANGRLFSARVNEIMLDVQTARYPGTVVENRRWARDYKMEMEEKPQWLPRSLAIAESLRQSQVTTEHT